MRIQPARSLIALFGAGLLASASTQAAPQRYQLDPTHTYASFEADHMGISTWRGKFNKTSGEVTLDRETGTGRVLVTIDPDSIDFGLDQMNAVARSDQLFNTAEHKYISYVGDLTDFVAGAPTRVVGSLTLRGVTKPVNLQLNSFKCIPHPLFKRELCGADAYAVFNREEFGMDAGKSFGFKMDVVLRIQIEALAVQ
ncbi:YceI family protein [Ideonella sp.]|uniref:YceI family protein n=1 Tax=Ideonella sp. TaxID=1929293 RepID=UPI003BB685AA